MFRMHLFGNKKESEDVKQTQEIKMATSDNDFSPPISEGPQSMPPISLNDNSSINANPFNVAQMDNSSMSSQMQNTISNNTYNPFQNLQMQQNYGMDMNNGFSGQNSQQMQQSQQNPMQSQNPFANEVNQMQGNSSMNSNFGMNMPQDDGPVSRDEVQQMVDELVEQVIEERWNKLVERVEKVAEWKEKQDQNINLIKEDIITIRDAFEKLEKRILTKINDYDKNVLDVNSEIKALEKVFQKITPTLVNNVNELSKIASNLRDGSKPKNLIDEDDLEREDSKSI